ncbi:phospholipid/cholesterol/gamma-HCH transport system permease protein [Marinobacter persicus]|uniref:Phospholipid/cholesterol/gamma-HCH transport system permease protein n=1 Tax=Marinobacter persicus TaxID=930118 RepID=A0A1I3WCF5_9GAMM|nr:ABC transporter permease [Marinobacter persicus]SFK05175.1 phospholipid/cholesterol/gamma-HCH transport system permease protein [Marinobacter persicus]
MSNPAGPEPIAAPNLHPGTVEIQDEALVFRGDWILDHYTHLKKQANRLDRTVLPAETDFTALGQLDTAGASVLVSLLGPDILLSSGAVNQLPPAQGELLRTVARSLAAPPARASAGNPIAEFLADIGERMSHITREHLLLAGFMGQTLATLVTVLPRPRRWRMTAFVAAVHDTGLNALPIVALLTFLVGAVVAFLGATVLEDFGATIYTVNLVAFSFLREFGVLLAAILLAGRTASAFTAQIGAMKVNEELDAIRTLGLSPIELLVVPRVLAMMVSLPILTFIGMMSGMFGGALVSALALDIPFTQFLSILQRDIALQHFLVGLGKAPVYAFLIAIIGCLEGFKVAGSAQSVGEHTTSSVVQSIFMVILLDAIAALFFMEMGW